MKRKINMQLLTIAAVAMIATLILAVGIFYELFQKEVVDELKAYAQVLSSTVNLQGSNEYVYETNIDHIRVTLIDENGKVTYDSYADEKIMENHSKRKEVAEALTSGVGEDSRISHTLSKNTFYYAILLKNGTILRVAKEVSSIWNVFASGLPIMLGMAILIYFICMVLARFLTRSIMEPIERLASDINHCSHISTYKELIPFIQTIQQQHEDIMRSAKIRQEFTANVSHELKTPLTSISGYAELIENGMANGDDMIRFAREIRRNSERLLTLINDIIRLSELDATEVEVNFESVDLYAIAQNSMQLLAMNAQNHGITLSLEGEHANIVANRSRIDEVVFNLCDNAIRYNNRGGKVMVHILKQDHKVILSVKDTGIGISKEHQERIFERFYRVDQSRSKSTGGTGLGLAIVKHIVAQHKAELYLESEVGQGTEIKIIFNEEKKDTEE